MFVNDDLYYFYRIWHKSKSGKKEYFINITLCYMTGENRPICLHKSLCAQTIPTQNQQTKNVCADLFCIVLYCIVMK